MHRFLILKGENMAELSINNILTDSEIENLFVETQDPPEDNKKEEQKENTEKQEETIEVDPETLFLETPEEVDSNKEKQEKEDTPSEQGKSSPNFYSSIAKALQEDSIFPDLNPEEITDAESFADLFEKQVQARLEDKIKRFDEAVNAGIDPSRAGQYEKTLSQLNGITSEIISDENNEQLRKDLIYMDLKNKGYTDEEAKEELQDIMDAGTDIKKAERALKSNINYFKTKYQEEVDEANKANQKLEEDRKEQAEKLKKEMFGNTPIFEGLQVSAEQKQKAYDAVCKPVYKDPKSGNYITAIQKYQLENPTDFVKKLGFLFTLTDNFKNLDVLVKTKVNKESKKAIRELENTLNNTRRNSDGNLRFSSGVSEDSESVFKGYTLDI